MSELEQVETTRLLRDWAEGDRAALDILAPRVYKELRRIAGHLMQASRAHALSRPPRWSTRLI